MRGGVKVRLSNAYNMPAALGAVKETFCSILNRAPKSRDWLATPQSVLEK
jgi:hypothetical protein